jgi:hypothetical protein
MHFLLWGSERGHPQSLAGLDQRRRLGCGTAELNSSAFQQRTTCATQMQIPLHSFSDSNLNFVSAPFVLVNRSAAPGGDVRDDIGRHAPKFNEQQLLKTIRNSFNTN